MEDNPKWFIFILAMGVFTGTHASAKSCGSVSVQSGDTCHSLKLKFDLVGCGDASFQKDTRIDCHDQSASVLMKTDLYRYNAELFSSSRSDGGAKWEVIGQLVQSDLDDVAESSDSDAALPIFKGAPKKEILAKKEKKLPESHAEGAGEMAEAKEGEKPAENEEHEGGGRAIASLGLANPNPYEQKEHKEGAEGSGITFSLFADGYYSYNFNAPPPIISATAPFAIAPNTNMRVYDFYHNTLSLGVAELTVKKTSPEVSFLVDLDFGPDADFNAGEMSTAVSGGPTITAMDSISKAIGQAVLTYTPLWAPNLLVEFGKLATHFSYEGWKSKDNWQYSRSTLFLFGLPLWHTGAHVGYFVIPKELQVSAYVYNSWDSLFANTSGKTLGAQVRWTPNPFFTLVYDFIGGPESPGIDPHTKTVHEVNLAWTLNPSVSIAMDAAYGLEDGLTPDEWSGVYVAGKYNFSRQYSISPRIEVYKDTRGVTLGGPPETLYGVTLTQSYKVSEVLETRLEFREDASTYSQRFITSTGVSGNQATGTLAVIYSLE